MKQYLIIGNGVAGTTAAEHIRKNDPQGAITIFTNEDLPFYYRIRLNEYISGDINEEDLIAKNKQWYADRQINLQTGVRVTDAKPEEQYIITENNDDVHYDSLLIATGSKSFIPPIKGSDMKGVFTLRTVQDAREIISYSQNSERVVLIGGGLLGLEAGNALRRRGKKVTVVEFFPRLLPRQLDVRGAARLKKIMEGMGFDFRTGATTGEIKGDGAAENVVLESGETLAADMVIISAGVRPNLYLAQCLGLECDKGIIVDSSLATSRSEVFAAGDVAEFQGALYGIWPAAMEQGKAAGTNMAGGTMPYHGSIMSNKLKVVGIDLASAGEIDAEDRLNARIDETDSVYKKIILDKDDRIIGCIMLGDTSDFMALNRAIKDGKKISEILC